MAVIGNASELGGMRTARFSGGNWTYSRTWLVKTNNKLDREDTVAGASGLPVYAEAHPANANAYANEISYAQADSTDTLWHVTATYTTERDLNSDPSNDEVLVSWDSEIYQEALFEDVDGEGIVNSAGDYFIDPVPTRDAAYLIAKIRANVTSVPTWVIDLQNAVNDSQITVGGLAIAAGLAKLQRLTIGEREKRDSTTFYPLSFELHIKKEGWRLEPLDAGFRAISGSDRNNIQDGNDSEVNQPVLLDGAGGELANPGPTTAVFLDFEIYQERDLTVMPGVS